MRGRGERRLLRGPRAALPRAVPVPVSPPYVLYAVEASPRWLNTDGMNLNRTRRKLANQQEITASRDRNLLELAIPLLFARAAAGVFVRVGKPARVTAYVRAGERASADLAPGRSTD